MATSSSAQPHTGGAEMMSIVLGFVGLHVSSLFCSTSDGTRILVMEALHDIKSSTKHN